MPRATLVGVTRYGEVCDNMATRVWFDLTMHPAHVCVCVTPYVHVAASIHNRYQWQRYGQRRDLMLAMAAPDRRDRADEVVQEAFLWHGTSDTDPMAICMGQDGVDFRRVRHQSCPWRLTIVVASDS